MVTPGQTRGDKAQAPVNAGPAGVFGIIETALRVHYARAVEDTDI